MPRASENVAESVGKPTESLAGGPARANLAGPTLRLKRFFDQNELALLGGEVMDAVGGVERNFAAAERDDFVVAIAFDAVDNDHLVVAIDNNCSEMPAVVAEIDLIFDVVVKSAFLAGINQQRLAARLDLGFIDEPLAVGAEHGLAHFAKSFPVLAIEDDELVFARARADGDRLAVGTEDRQSQLVVAGAFLAIGDDQELVAEDGAVGHAFAVRAEDEAGDGSVGLALVAVDHGVVIVAVLDGIGPAAAIGTERQTALDIVRPQAAIHLARLAVVDHDVVKAAVLRDIRQVLAVSAQEQLLDLLEPKSVILVVIENEVLFGPLVSDIAHLAAAAEEEVDRHQRRAVRVVNSRLTAIDAGLAHQRALADSLAPNDALAI